MKASIASPGVERWQQRFEVEPVAALDALLTGRMSVGQYDRARPADALTQMLSLEKIPVADEAMQTWLSERLGKPLPEGLSPKRYADALVEAFRAVHGLPLPASRNWCATRPAELRAWLCGFYQGPSRDPESALLIALAHHQLDRSLMFHWHDVIRRGRPVEHVNHALIGLRLMPADDQGTVEHGVPKALLRGMLDYGETLVRFGDKKGQSWLRELDFLSAVYPMSQEVWSRRFREVVQVRDVSHDLHNWLDQRYPETRQIYKAPASKGILAPPSMDELNNLVLRIASDFKSAKSALSAYFDHHRHYAQESGDSYYLVRSFARLGELVLKHDPTWARELAHESARWEPNNHHAWSLLARALEREGDWRRAEAVYWNARRRFPQDPVNHAQLGHALIMHNQAELGEAVFRQATRFFPNDPVTWSELGHSLRVTGRREEAVTAYREAQHYFSKNSVIVNALADTLIDMGRLDEAESVVQKAELIATSEKSQRILSNIRERLKLSQNGSPVKLRKIHPPLEVIGGDISALTDIIGIDLSQAPFLGRAALWRRSGNKDFERTRAELNALQDGSAKLIELGLLNAAEHGWRAAAEWFESCWENYAGDGTLRVHRLRSLARAGDTVDWASEKILYPELLPVIITEEIGRPPRLDLDLEDQDLSEEQRQNLWYTGLASRKDEALLDFVQEDFLTARQVA